MATDNNNGFKEDKSCLDVIGLAKTCLKLSETKLNASLSSRSFRQNIFLNKIVPF